jgi:hypothetical protein
MRRALILLLLAALYGVGCAEPLALLLAMVEGCECCCIVWPASNVFSPRGQANIGTSD